MSETEHREVCPLCGGKVRYGRCRDCGEVYHDECPPSAHDFDPDGTTPDEQARDEHGRRLCNDCGALCFYCTNDEWYHHAPASAEPCFLCKDEGWDVLIPAAIPVPADWPGNEVNRA